MGGAGAERACQCQNYQALGLCSALGIFIGLFIHVYMYVPT